MTTLGEVTSRLGHPIAIHSNPGGNGFVGLHHQADAGPQGWVDDYQPAFTELLGCLEPLFRTFNADTLIPTHPADGCYLPFRLTDRDGQFADVALVITVPYARIAVLLAGAAKALALALMAIVREERSASPMPPQERLLVAYAYSATSQLEGTPLFEECRRR